MDEHSTASSSSSSSGSDKDEDEDMEVGNKHTKKPDPRTSEEQEQEREEKEQDQEQFQDEEDVEVATSQTKPKPDPPPNDNHDHDHVDVDVDVDAESNSPEATPEDEPTSTEEQEVSTSSRSRFFVLGVCLLCLCLAGLVLGLGLGLPKKDDATSNKITTLETGPPSTLQPTLDPRNEQILEFLNSILDISGEIYIDGTPANAAAYWLLEQDPSSQVVDRTRRRRQQQQVQMMDELEVVEKARISQRFLLALFYYATSFVGKSPWLSCSPPPEATPLLKKCDFQKPTTSNGTPLLYMPISGTRWLSTAHECDWQGVTCKEQLGEKEQTVRVVTDMEIGTYCMVCTKLPLYCLSYLLLEERWTTQNFSWYRTYYFFFCSRTRAGRFFGHRDYAIALFDLFEFILQ